MPTPSSSAASTASRSAKGELVEALPGSGTAVLNADDPRVAAMAARTGAAVLTFGAAGDVRTSDVVLDAAARASFVVDTPWGRGRVRLAVPGLHMVTNASAAIAVAGIVGVELGSAIDALSTATLSAMRMEVCTAPTGATVVNDAYNANPTSMRAALEALAAMRADRRVAVLGLMGEIEDPEPAHRRIAEYAVRSESNSSPSEPICTGSNRPPTPVRRSVTSAPAWPCS